MEVSDGMYHAVLYRQRPNKEKGSKPIKTKTNGEKKKELKEKKYLNIGKNMHITNYNYSMAKASGEKEIWQGKTCLKC